MWKKPFTAHKKTLLKSSDKRKLKEQLLQAFRGLKQEDLEELIPQKADVSVTKVQGSHTLIYTKDEQPLFIDSDGRQNFYPSGMALFF
jgi:translation initiation factor 2D